MSRVLSELLGADRPSFGLMVKDLERVSGGDGVDIKLATEIAAKIKLKTRELGLDPDDSTGKELYHALLQLVKLHDQHLLKALGAANLNDANELLPFIKAVPEKLGLNIKCWAIKHSAAKRLLAAKPPKNIMKQLGYRSIDSLLKRENITEIYSALQFAEDETWFKKFNSHLAHIKPTEFESRDIEIAVLKPAKWGNLIDDFVKDNGHNICASAEMGSILLLPQPSIKLEGSAIILLTLLLEAINEIQMYSALFKLWQVRSNFGRLVAESVTEGLGFPVKVAGQNLHWRSLQKHFSRKGGLPPVIFEPHLLADDLNWRKAEDTLFYLEPSLGFWRELDYVGAMFDNKLPVSFNLLDVATSFVNNLAYGEHSVYHLREALWSEVFIRYIGKDNVEAEVLRQLENDMTTKKLTVNSYRLNASATAGNA